MAAAITGDYYVGSITRAEAEEKVKLASHGDFVVRLDGDGHYSMIVNDSGGCAQYKIRLVDGTFQFGKNIFPSMDNLIETLRKKAIGSKSGVPIVLKNAAFTLKTTRPTGRQRPTADDRRRLAAAQGAGVSGGIPSHEQVVSLTRSAGGSGGDAPHISLVVLKRDEKYGLGIKVTEHAEPGCVGCVIKAINNPALEGKLKIGQKILRVNGKKVDTISVPDLGMLLKPMQKVELGLQLTDYKPPQNFGELSGSMKKKINLYIAPIDVDGFNDLDTNFTKKSAVEPQCCNKRFNRYLDILPNKETRVPLSLRPMEPESYYINANFVRGHGSLSAVPNSDGFVPKGSYIAAQGPMLSTICAFIRMIWEHNVLFVVQTTNFIENRKRKCERYFPTIIGPEGTRDFEGISVTLMKAELHKGYKYSTLVFQKGAMRRTIEHFWFISWPDHGVPTDRLGRIFPNHVIDMLLHVRERRTCVDAFASPLLVHCSAGVGRTGTFIVIDHVISAIARQQKVDIIDIVKRCREDRMAIVQHTIQYKFAYQACINYAESVLEKNDGEIFALASPKVGADSIYEATTGAGGKQLFRLKRGAMSLKKAKEDKIVFQETPAAPEEAIVPEDKNDGSNLLEDEPWFFGNLQRDAMSAILKDTPIGSFGVRVSSQAGCFVLTFQQEDKANHGKRLQSILIQPCQKPGTSVKMYKLDQCSDRLFGSVADLVAYFITTAVSYVDDRTGQTHKLFLDNTTDAQ